jgi:transcriptional regulator GlxA family with amidase domain
MHFFVHFRLVEPHGTAHPGVYVVHATVDDVAWIRRLRRSLIEARPSPSLSSTLSFAALAARFMSRLDPSVWVVHDTDPRIQSLVAYIKANPRTDLSNRILAERVNLSSSACARLFRRSLGCSPQQYVRRTRMAQAGILLTRRELSIESVASACGYGDRFAFTRAFARRFGISPGRYRKETLFH